MMTQEHRDKIRLSCLGINRGRKSAETRRKISLAKTGVPSKKKGIRSGIIPKTAFKRGYTPWNKGTKVLVFKVKKEKIIMSDQTKLEHKRFWNQRYKATKRKALGSHTIVEWYLLKEFYKNMCLCCGKYEPEIQLSQDHIKPLSLGGTDDISNIQPLCLSCNVRKHAKYVSYLPMNSTSLDSLGRGGELT